MLETLPTITTKLSDFLILKMIFFKKKAFTKFCQTHKLYSKIFFKLKVFLKITVKQNLNEFTY